VKKKHKHKMEKKKGKQEKKDAAHLDLKDLDYAGHVWQGKHIHCHQALHGPQSNGQGLFGRIGVVAGQQKGSQGNIHRR
jgi:hypothetical protein